MPQRPPKPRDFSEFWRRKHRAASNCIPGWRDPTWGTDRTEAAAAHRREHDFIDALYSGPVPVLAAEVEAAMALIDATVDASMSAGHRIRSMYAHIPLAVHRAWCDGLVTFADNNGWPVASGIGVRADEWARPPDDWDTTMPALEPGFDLVVVHARNLGRPIAERYALPGTHPEPVQAIYHQLRVDGWAAADAEEAAKLIGRPR